MAFVNEERKEISCKIVYYGPPRGGKSTSLTSILGKVKRELKGDLVSITSDENRTLYFDFVPLTLGKIKGYTIRLHLYTVPGDATYDANRKIISKGLDGLVFVADSQLEKMEQNIESMEELKEIAASWGMDLDSIPLVIQYNKRDLPDVVPTDRLRAVLNPRRLPDFETVAIKGKGVYEALEAAARGVLLSLKNT